MEGRRGGYRQLLEWENFLAELYESLWVSRVLNGLRRARGHPPVLHVWGRALPCPAPVLIPRSCSFKLELILGVSLQTSFRSNSSFSLPLLWKRDPSCLLTSHVEEFQWVSDCPGGGMLGRFRRGKTSEPENQWAISLWWPRGDTAPSSLVFAHCFQAILMKSEGQSDIWTHDLRDAIHLDEQECSGKT